MDTLKKVGKKVRKVGEKMGEKFGTSKTIRKYVKPFSGKNYVEIERCLIEVEPAELRDIYSGHPEKVSGTTEEQQKCLQEFAEKRLAELEIIKQKKVSQITDDDLVELKPAIEPPKYKEIKTQIEQSKKITKSKKIKEYLQKVEDGRTQYTGEEMDSPLGIHNKRMTKVETSKVPGSDESDEIFIPKIIIKEPTVQEILDTNGQAYIDWSNSLPRKKGGKSRKNKPGNRRHRKTRR